jgi:hypothetical protein
MKNDQLLITQRIEPQILSFRGQKVIIDRDLAQIYGVKTSRLNEQLKRNKERFPEDFVFQLTREEAKIWIHSRSQFATFNPIFSWRSLRLGERHFHAKPPRVRT